MGKNVTQRKSGFGIKRGPVLLLLGLLLWALATPVFAAPYEAQTHFVEEEHEWAEDATVTLRLEEPAPAGSRVNLFAWNKNDEDDPDDDTYTLKESFDLAEGDETFIYNAPMGKTDKMVTLLAVVTDLDDAALREFEGKALADPEPNPPFPRVLLQRDTTIDPPLCTHACDGPCDRNDGKPCSHISYGCMNLCTAPPPAQWLCTHACWVPCDNVDPDSCPHKACLHACRADLSLPDACTHVCGEACPLPNPEDCVHAGCDKCSASPPPPPCTHACGATCGRIDGLPCDHASCQHSCEIPSEEERLQQLLLQKVTIQPEVPLAVEHVESVSLAKTQDSVSGSEILSTVHVKSGDTLQIELTFTKNKVDFDELNSTVAGGSITDVVETDENGGQWKKFLITFELGDLGIPANQEKPLEYSLLFQDQNQQQSPPEDRQYFAFTQATTRPGLLVESITCLGPMDFATEDYTASSKPEAPLDAPFERVALEGDWVLFDLETKLERPFAVTGYTVASAMPISFSPPYSFATAHQMRYQANPADVLLDDAPIPLSAFSLVDLAGNQAGGSLVEGEKCVLYYASPNAPVEDRFSMVSPSFEEGRYYAKKDDQITLTWETGSRLNHSQLLAKMGENKSTEPPQMQRDHQRHLWVITFTVRLEKTEPFPDETALVPEVFYGDAPFAFHPAAPKPNEVIFLHPLKITSVQMHSVDTDRAQTPDSGYAINGSLIEAVITLNHKTFLDETLTIAGLVAEEKKPDTRPQSGKPFYYYSAETRSYTLRLLLPSYKNDPIFETIRLTENSPIELTVAARDYAQNHTAMRNIAEGMEQGYAKPLTYFAPLELHSVNITATEMRQDKDGYLAIKGGEEIGIEFTTSHPVLPGQMELSLGSHQAQPQFSEKYAGGIYTYTARYTTGEAPLLELDDMEKLAPVFTVGDRMGQSTRYPADYRGENQKWTPRYYAPIEITDVTITSSNKNDESLFAKDEDTVYVNFSSNHFLDVEGSIAGRGFKVSSKRPDHNSEITEWTLSYTLANKDLKDLEVVPFTFTVRDITGNTPVSYTNQSQGVKNELTYYEPIEATASIASNNKRSEYAKNGDSITISLEAQHKTAPSEASIGSRDLAGNLDFKEKPEVTMTLPGGESTIIEGELFFSVLLEDAAGNTFSVSETEDESKVTYDRTAPEVSILPGFNGVTNRDVGLSLLYSDMYLDRETLSCTVNQSERVPGGEKTNPAEPSVTFTQALSITKEGEYKIEGNVFDMAGNEAEFKAACSFIIDKTGPELTFDLDPKTYAAGFYLGRLFSIEEELVKEVACTLTDGAGVHDWTLEAPIETEGKKTVTFMAEDLAGNVSVPITCDLYIDATAPLPTVRETGQDAELVEGEENVITEAGASLAVSLARLHLGDEGPDRFTRLELLDENGNLAQNLLEGEALADGSYTLRLPALGRYTLVAQAADDVNNTTGLLAFPINYREMYWAELALQGTPLAGFTWVKNITNTQLVVAASAVVLLLGGGITLLAARRYRRKKAALPKK